MSDTDFEFNTDFALMDRQLEKFKEENARIMAEWYKESESLHSQVQDLRAALASISLFVSAGIGDEGTTAEDYAKRIKDGIVRMVLDLSTN